MKPDTIVMMPIGDILPYSNNPRTHDEISEIKESIRRVGFRGSIWVDANNVIIAGHGRYMAAKELGMKEVPVSVMDDLTEAEVKYLRIKDNRAGEQSDWDYEAYQTELDELRAMDFDVGDIELDVGMIDLDDNDPGEIEETDVPDAPLVAVSKRGQIYRLGRHRLMCGDSTSKEDMERLMDGHRADITFTSPPYNAHHMDVVDSNGVQKGTQKKYLADNDNRSDEEYQEFLNRNIELLLDNSDEVFYNIGVGSGSKKAIAGLLERFSDNFKDLLYWKKTNPMPVIADGVISSAVELIIAFGKNGTRSFNHFDDRLFHGVIEGLSASTSNQYADIHKATFPVYLPSEIITRFTERGGSVLDCFGGTGTTMIACEQLERDCYMMELEPVYVDVIIKRWEDFTGQKAELVEE